MPKQILTQSRLKELLHYDPETGVFTRVVKPCNRVKAGDVAGCKNSRGYLLFRVDRKKYCAHRLAFLYMTGEFPPDQVDHVNHIRDDNRWVNLLAVTRSENMRNKGMLDNNVSGITGVRWREDRKRWVSEISDDDVKRGLYYGKSFYKAQFRRKMAEIKYGYHENHGKTAEARLI